MKGTTTERRRFLGTVSKLAAIITLLLHSQVGVSSFRPLFSTVRRRGHASRISLPILLERKGWVGKLKRPSNSVKTCSALFVSLNPPSTSSNVGSDGTRVVFQKVVKSPLDAAGNGNPLFLGQLVEFLQDHFELPEDLPMIYKSIPMDDQKDDDSTNCIRRWDSPLSPSPEATRLDVEIVAIYTSTTNHTATRDPPNNSQDRGGLPTMAMVAVRKSTRKMVKPPSPMAQNLFDDSERRILRALDRGLDKFAAGKIRFDGVDSSNKSYQNNVNLEAAQTAMIEEMLDDAAVYHPSIPKEEPSRDPSPPLGSTNGQNILDAEYSKLTEPTTKSTGKTSKALDASEDFAVQAAARAAARKKTSNQTNVSTSLDFAVAEARKFAAAKKQRASSTDTAAKDRSSNKQSPDSASRSSPVKPPALKIEEGDGRSFRTVVSTPKMYKDKAKQQLRAGKTAGPNSKPVNGSAEPRQQQSREDTHDADVREVPTAHDGIEMKSPSNPLEGSATTKRKKPVSNGTNIGKEDSGSKKNSDRDSPVMEMMPSDQEIRQTANDIMEELANQVQDMTPEELLQDVLKFGETQDRENRVGSGFVSGAFEKAKELLREQKRYREERLKAQVVDQVTQDLQTTNAERDRPNVEAKVASSEEEELRRLFEAGEKFADGRITLATRGADSSKMTAEDNRLVDELIASDKTVSDHARKLDDELAELEVRINQAPGEELDAPGQYPVFDIFSGPEVYNRNVDAATAVNWPGALPGTKTKPNNLPKELGEAVKQASFAAEVLQNLVERKSPVTSKTEFFVGDQQLSQQQIESLQAVANEAIEIGIIPNPLVLMEERSRLQMLLDELWNQPEDRTREIVSNFKDLLLSENFVTLVRERLEAMAQRDLDSLRLHINDEDGDTALEERHAREREILGQLVVTAQLLLKETRALGAELEAQQIEVIRSICKVAMDPSHLTEEDTATALTDAVRDMRPLFDDMFVAYLKYAVAEEEGRLARAGLLGDPEHCHWLSVLQIVQQGVHNEIAKGINRYIEHIWYVLRMETPVERKMLLSKLIDDMPTLDVRPFVRVVGNIVGSLGEGAKGEFDGVNVLGGMANKLLQLHRDMKELLPPERIDDMSRDADEWAAKKREKMMQQRGLAQQRLKGARDTEQYDGEIESIGRRGETEMFR